MEETHNTDLIRCRKCRKLFDRSTAVVKSQSRAMYNESDGDYFVTYSAIVCPHCGELRYAGSAWG